MKTLLSIELMKLWKLTTFRVMILIYVIVMPLIIIMIGNIPFPLPIVPDLKEVSSFPNIWNYATYAASWMNLLVGIVIVVITANEVKYKTMKQNVIDGLSKKQVIFSKFYLISILALILTVYTWFVASTLGFIYSDELNYFKDIYYLGIYFIQTLGYFAFAFFLTILVRYPALSIILYIVSITVEAILGFIALPQAIYAYFPLNTFSHLTPFPLFKDLLATGNMDSELKDYHIPELSTHVIVAVFYILLLFVSSYLILRRRDL